MDTKKTQPKTAETQAARRTSRRGSAISPPIIPMSSIPVIPNAMLGQKLAVSRFILGKTKSELALPFSQIAMAGADEDDPDPVQVGSPVEYVYKLRIEFPAKYTVTAPLPFALTRDYGHYEVTYQIEANVFTAERDPAPSLNEFPSPRAPGATRPAANNTPPAAQFRPACPHSVETSLEGPQLGNHVGTPGHVDRSWLAVDGRRAVRDATIAGEAPEAA